MIIPKEFREPFSKGSPWITAFLLKYSSKLPSSEALKVSSSLYKEILRVNEEIEKYGLPQNLYAAHVHPNVQTGIFLKPDSPPIEVGDFIGIYTGVYELVESDITTGTSYAYDVAQNVRLKKEEKKHVLNAHHKNNEYSIQTNAIPAGNFTRYINHTSSEPNIEAIVSKLPDGRMEILLFALHPIEPGEQLLSCYGGLYWKALGFIPDDMTPDTYILTPSLKVKLQNKIKPFTPQQKEILTPLRNVLVHLPKSFEKSVFFKPLKKKLPSLGKKQKKEIDAIEEIVLERGIPRNFQISCQKGKVKFSLKKGEKTIKKNTLIGTISGTFSFKKSSSGFLLAEKDEKKLFLDCSKETNFLSHIPLDLKKSNLSLKLYFDKEENSLSLLVFASKAIKEGDLLFLKSVETITL